MAVPSVHDVLYAPGRMESGSVHFLLTHLRCPLQRFGGKDLDQTLCGSRGDDENSLLGQNDPATFDLHLQFMRAHGIPKGELTTFTNARVIPSVAVGGRASLQRRA